MIPTDNNPLGARSKTFITRWNVSAGETIHLPLRSDTAYNMFVKWGDGSSETITNYANNTHTYTNAGTYDIKISGSCPRWDFSAVTTSKNNVIGVINWGDIGFTAMTSAFNSCSNLVTLAPYMPDTANYAWCFASCSNILSVPKDLLGKSVSATSLCGIFYGTNLTNLPSGLFHRCINVKDMSYLFYGCEFTSIPSDLFTYNPLITTISRSFSACSQLENIPANLLANNSAVTNCEHTFSGCSGLSEIPAGLFDNTPAVTKYKNTFRDCTDLTGNAPALWNLAPAPDGTECFYNCTGLTNYADIPVGWK